MLKNSLNIVIWVGLLWLAAAWVNKKPTADKLVSPAATTSSSATTKAPVQGQLGVPNRGNAYGNSYGNNYGNAAGSGYANGGMGFSFSGGANGNGYGNGYGRGNGYN